MNIVDVVEIVGALLILAGFAAAQRGRLSIRSLTYLGLNVVGSLILAILALLHQSWGFLLLEGTWAIVSAVSIVGVLSQRPRGTVGPTRSGVPQGARGARPRTEPGG
jgi:hypothetical protein